LVERFPIGKPDQMQWEPIQIGIGDRIMLEGLKYVGKARRFVSGEKPIYWKGNI
jgi:hypothetical protein